MQKIYLFLIICLLSNRLVNAQPYESIFGETSTSWNIYEEIADAGDTHLLHIYNDTTFNGFSYKYVTDDYEFNSGYLREDTMEGKVWFYSPETELEYLIMDLSLAVGDTFYIDSNTETGLFALVDAVFFLDDKKHIHLNFPLIYGNDSLEFIEGMGTNAGIYFPYNYYEYFNIYLLCAYKDDIQTYSNSYFDGICEYNWTYTENMLQQKPSLSVFPNPCSDVALIKFNNIQKNNFRCVIYNSSMQIVYERKDISDDHFVFNKGNLNQGIYFISLSNQETSITGSFVLK